MNRRIINISIITCGLCTIAFLVHLFLAPVAEHKLAELKPGMTEQEIFNILGSPTSRISSQSSPEVTFRYEVPLRFGWVDIWLLPETGMTDYNYERF